ncbi:MAG: guanylate kinase [Bacilli bacterium]|nr:guanylate kinase [Bacilli bacterium]
MIVLAGASASGKTEAAKMLASKYGITKVITTTTRPMREGEKDGRDYFFVSQERFEEMIKEGRFVEYTSYNGYMYGSTKDQIASNKCVVIDPAGLRAYISLNDESIITFFLDSSEDTRHRRMLERGDKPENVESRIEHDRKAFITEALPVVDYHINTELSNVEEVADLIYKVYKEQLKTRKING